MARLVDPIIQTSMNLRGLPFRPLIDCTNDNSVTVTLRPLYGQPVSCEAVSFALAWAGALNKLKGAALIEHVDEVGA